MLTLGIWLSNLSFYLEIQPMSLQIFLSIVFFVPDWSEISEIITICQIFYIYTIQFIQHWNTAVWHLSLPTWLWCQRKMARSFLQHRLSLLAKSQDAMTYSYSLLRGNREVTWNCYVLKRSQQYYCKTSWSFIFFSSPCKVLLRFS